MSTLAPHPDAVIWLDGRMVPWAEATTHVLTHSLHYGSGVFEGLRAFATERGPAIFRLQEHTRPPVHFGRLRRHDYPVLPRGG